jgi:hypothetical protein
MLFKVLLQLYAALTLDITRFRSAALVILLSQATFVNEVLSEQCHTLVLLYLSHLCGTVSTRIFHYLWAEPLGLRS